LLFNTGGFVQSILGTFVDKEYDPQNIFFIASEN